MERVVLCEISHAADAAKPTANAPPRRIK